MAENEDKSGGDEAAAALVTEATSMGWSPKESWRGDPDKWIDAETFVTRGREVLPILRANNKQLQAKVDTLSGQVAKANEQLTASMEAIEALKEFNSDATLAEAERTKGDLVASLKQARTDGDVDTEIALRDQIDEVNTVIKASKGEEEEARKSKPKPNGEDKEPKLSPETRAAFESWKTRNPWFGTDVRRTRLATVISDELRSDPANALLLGEAFMDKVAEEVDAVLGDSSTRQPVDKVEGSRGGRERQGGGKSFADLPADAKEACAYYSKRLVGEGKAYKTEAEWQKVYVTKYFAEGAPQ